MLPDGTGTIRCFNCSSTINISLAIQLKQHRVRTILASSGQQRLPSLPHLAAVVRQGRFFYAAEALRLSM